MANFHLVTFDPGGITGWAYFIVDEHAFSRPENTVLNNVLSWNSGQFYGEEVKQLSLAQALIAKARGWGKFETNKCHVVSEAFQLRQLKGGANLLSPVRINAVLDWICQTQFGLKLQLQHRTMRTSVTPERLRLFGFEGHWSTTGKRKDEFAAMQHGIVWLRRLKDESRSRPWKITANGRFNDHWDCACRRKRRCDLDHPK